MSLLDLFLGPQEAEWAKKKKKEPDPAPVSDTSKKGKQQKQKPAAPPTQQQQTKPEPEPSYAPIGYPPARSQSLNLDLGDLLKPQPPIDPELLKEAADYLVGLGNSPTGAFAFPTFDISDIATKTDKIDEILAQGLPLNMQPIAAFMDTVYGTNAYAKTPNQRQEFLKELKAVKDLHGDSAALQQVKGQARLEEYKARLKQILSENGIVSPLERSQILENVSKALRGSSGDQMSKLRMMIDLKKYGLEKENQEYERNRQTQLDFMKFTDDLAEKWDTAPLVTKYREVRSSAAKTRSLLAGSSDGIKDYATVIQFIRTLDPDSTVMFNEAKGVYDSTGIIGKMLQFPDRIWNGGRLTDAQKREIMNSIDDFEAIHKSAYEEGERKMLLRAKNRGIPNPGAVVEGVREELGKPSQIYEYEGFDEKGIRRTFRVPTDRRKEFEAKAERNKIKNLRILRAVPNGK